MVHNSVLKLGQGEQDVLEERNRMNELKEEKTFVILSIIFKQYTTNLVTHQINFILLSSTLPKKLDRYDDISGSRYS